jgi:hypothetical protein
LVFRGFNDLDKINNINSKNGSHGRNNDYLNNTVSYANKNGKVFEVGIATHPADRYTYSFDFKRDDPNYLLGKIEHYN